ncbi:MAG: hypothetical protein ACREDY_10655, partial [Bradyrhizobium sp.]
MNTPYHEYITASDHQSEQISIGNTLYVKSNGRWQTLTQKSQTSQRDADRIAREQGMKLSDCRYLRDEDVKGEAAAVYAAHGQATTLGGVVTDTQYWISKSRGLPLRSESDGEYLGMKVHTSKRMEYDHVQAPGGEQERSSRRAVERDVEKAASRVNGGVR